MTTTTTTTAQPTTREVAEWLRQQTWSDFAQNLADYFDRRGTLTDRQLSSARGMMAKCATRTDNKRSATVTEDGMYLTPDGDVVKVQAARGSGNLYAKLLTVEGDKGHFEYAAGLIRRLDPAWKMTLEDAQKWGALYGICCNCGATLTDENSIAAGIGPICASRF